MDKNGRTRYPSGGIEYLGICFVFNNLPASIRRWHVSFAVALFLNFRRCTFYGSDIFSLMSGQASHGASTLSNLI